MRALSMIPLPLRIALVLLVAILFLKVLGGGLGALLIVAAIVLWVLVLLTLFFSFGWLNPLATVPGVGRFLGYMSNTRAVSDATNSTDAGSRGQLSESDRAKLFSEANARMDDLEGIEATKDEIFERLIQPAIDDPENPFATQAPALVAVFAGPRGVGKTTAAVATAHMMAGKSATETANVVHVRATDLRSGQFGSASGLAKAKAEQAIGGTLLIDDASWLLEDDGYGGAGPAEEFGQALLDVLVQHPRKTFVIIVGSKQDIARLQRAPDVSKWLGKLTVRAIEFQDLPDDALIEVLERRLEDAGWALEDDMAANRTRRLIDEIKDRQGAEFDNAEQCRRLAEQLIETVRSSGDDEDLRRKVVTVDMVRTTEDHLE